MLRRFLMASAVVLAFVGLALAQQAHYGKNGPALLPDPKVTPGVVALTDKDKNKVCTTKWGRDVRHVTAKMKADAYAQYGAVKKKGVCCEVDHLISRELGGADDPRNLWPQPYSPKPGAYQKDWLETKLHKEFCAGNISLADAQKEIATDWYAAYLKRKNNHNP